MSQKTTKEHSSEMLYGIDEQPPKGMAVLLAFQHILAAFAGIIAVPLVVASALGLSVEDTSIYGIGLNLCCWDCNYFAI